MQDIFKVAEFIRIENKWDPKNFRLHPRAASNLSSECAGNSETQVTYQIWYC